MLFHGNIGYGNVRQHYVIYMFPALFYSVVQSLQHSW
jgi:hypothetical protein